MLISGNKSENETEIFTKNNTSQKKPLLNFFIDRYVDAYRLQLDELALYSRTKKSPISSFEDGRRALIIANAASTSLKLKKQKDSKDLFYFTLTHFFIDLVNSKIWKSNNSNLKNITSKDNISKFYNTLQKLSLNIQDQKVFLNLSVDLLRIIFPSVEDESQPDDKDLDEGNDEEDFNQQQNQEENQAQKPEESQLEEYMHTPEND